jgi:hypothetical protein
MKEDGLLKTYNPYNLKVFVDQDVSGLKIVTPDVQRPKIYGRRCKSILPSEHSGKES